MRKWQLLLSSIVIFFGLNACARTVVQDLAANFPAAQVNLTNRMQGYFIEGTNIVFIFDEGLWGVENPASVEVRGTFTGWKQLPGWTLTRSSRAGVWHLTKPLSEVNVPSNSGQPEFKFVHGNGSWLSAMKTLPAGYTWPDGYNGLNNVILFSGDSPAEIAVRRLQATTFRTNYDSDAQMANFREVCSGAIAHRVLYRSYNPVIASKTTLPLENARLAAAQKLITANGIRAVVNLSDTAAELTAAQPYPYYLYLMNGGNVHYANISYSIAYFQSAAQSFAKPMADIVRFIGTHDGPYLVHCRLGTDRTGTVIAVLEAFMGSKWSDIKADYLRSNELGIGEYRSANLLLYSINNMLHTEITDDSVLSNEMRAYLKTTAGLSDAELDALYAKLAGI